MRMMLLTPGCIGYKLLELYAGISDEVIMIGYQKYSHKFSAIIGQADPAKIKNVKIIFAKNIWQYLKIAVSTINKKKVDIILSQDPSSGFIAAITRLFGKARLIHVICSDHIRSFTYSHTKPPLKQIIELIIWIQLKAACSSSDVITLSHYLKHKAKIYGAKKIEVIPAYGVNTKYFRPLKKNKIQKKRLNICNEKIILTAARFTPEKGINYLISAFKQINNLNPNTKLIIIGYGSEELPLKDLVTNLGLNKQVIFAGAVQHKDMPQYYNLCDIFVMPSMIEGLGFASAEAMACEKPVIASNAGGIPDIVIDKVTGILVKPKDVDGIALTAIKLLKKPNLAKKLGKAGRKHVKEIFEESLVYKQLRAFCLKND